MAARAPDRSVTRSDRAPRHVSVPDAAGTEQRTTPAELFWDLVFVFAVTQVTTLLYTDLSWAGFGRAMLVLALVWWAWSAFVWAMNAHDPDYLRVRGVLFLAMIFAFLVALSVPRAFGEAAVAISMALLLAGSVVGDPARTWLWVTAAAIDYAGAAWLTRERLRGIQHVAVTHFAERYSLFIIICLGESIIAIGVGAADRDLSGELVAAVALALLVTGIIVSAIGLKASVGHPDEALDDGPRLALCGGVALYLGAHTAFDLRLGGEPSIDKAAAAGVCLITFAATA